MYDPVSALKMKVAQGVGCTFDVISGKVNRAPKPFLALNLEWLYRLLGDPRRVWRQGALVTFARCISRREGQSFSGCRRLLRKRGNPFEYNDLGCAALLSLGLGNALIISGS